MGVIKLPGEDWDFVFDETIPAGIVSAGIRADSARIIGSDGQQLVEWDVRSCSQVRQHPLKGVVAVGFGENEDVVTVEGDGTIHLRRGPALEPAVAGHLDVVPHTVVAHGMWHLDVVPHTVGYYGGQIVAIGADDALAACAYTNLGKAYGFSTKRLHLFRRCQPAGRGFHTVGLPKSFEIQFFNSSLVTVRFGPALLLPDEARPFYRVSHDGEVKDLSAVGG